MPRMDCTTVGQRFYDTWHVIKLCRFNVLLPLLVGLFLVVVPNGQEVLLRLETEGWSRQLLTFGLMLILWPITVWYWARVILSFRFDGWPPQPDADAARYRWILTCQLLLPRLCGMFALLMLLWAIGVESEILYRQSGERGTLIRIVLGAIPVFALIVWPRRAVMARVMGARRAEEEVRPLMFTYRGAATPEVEFYRSWRELPGSTLMVLGVSLVLFTILPFLAFMNADRAVSWAPQLGSATILLLAASGWTCFGAWVMYAANHYRIPIFLLSFLWLFAVSRCNDNHLVRNVVPATAETGTFDEYLKRWLERRQPMQLPLEYQHEFEDGASTAIPLVVVTAEGGGLRAAYWTASVLSRLEQAYPGLACHIFAISGVSGGSLGAAVFDAHLVKSRGETPPQVNPCSEPTAISPPDVHRDLQRDFVAPVFAMMLYPDLTQRFLWFRVYAWDRGAALETAWEQAWPGMKVPFDDLWTGTNRYTIPGLILNSTSVEEGKRVLFSNLPSLPAKSYCRAPFKATEHPPFQDVMDLRLALNPDACSGKGDGPPPRLGQTLRLSSAVHNSARFTFVSPPGTVGRNLHLVDGGYFDNSGAVTALELVRGIEQYRRRTNSHVLPIVLHIASDPNPSQVTGRVAVPLRNGTLQILDEAPKEVRNPLPVEVNIDAYKHPEIARAARTLKAGDAVTLLIDHDNHVIEIRNAASVLKSQYLSELVTPVFAVFRAWAGHSSAAAVALRRHVGDGRFFEFRLVTRQANLPLGWTLSKGSWQAMNEQVDNRFLSPGCIKRGADTPFAFLLRCRP
jgi:predicted acylesterase/phospholipase RssA